MQQLVHCVMLSPDMNDMYKIECTNLLKDAVIPKEPLDIFKRMLVISLAIGLFFGAGVLLKGGA